MSALAHLGFTSSLKLCHAGRPSLSFSFSIDSRFSSPVNGGSGDSGRELISLVDKHSPKNESDPVSLKE
jgi:hypothetical protein